MKGVPVNQKRTKQPLSRAMGRRYQPVVLSSTTQEEARLRYLLGYLVEEQLNTPMVHEHQPRDDCFLQATFPGSWSQTYTDMKPVLARGGVVRIATGIVYTPTGKQQADVFTTSLKRVREKLSSRVVSSHPLKSTATETTTAKTGGKRVEGIVISKLDICLNACVVFVLTHYLDAKTTHRHGTH